MRKNSSKTLIAGLLLFAVSFLISRVQFFACPVVEISNDTGEYVLWIDHFLAKGEMPPNNYIPIGYPIILKVLTTIHDSHYTVVAFQNIVTFLCFGLLIATVWRFYDKLIYFIAVGCVAIYVNIPNNLYYDIYILSESLYNSSLVLLVTAMVYFANTRNKKSSRLLSLALALPILFRPVGIFTIVIFVLLVIYLLLIKRKELVASFLTPYLVIFGSLSAYSLFVSGNPLFFYARAAAEYAEYKKPKVQSVTDSIYAAAFNKLTRFDRAVIQYKNYTTQSQMYTRIEETNDKYFERDFPHTNEYSCCHTGYLDSTKTTQRQIIFKEFYDTDKMSYLVAREKQVKQSRLFKLYDLIQNQIIKRIFLNQLWIALLFISFIAASLTFVLSGWQNTKAWLLMLIIMVNLGTIGAVLSGNHLPLPRYSYPGEFIFLLQLPFIIDLIRDRIYAFK